MGVQDASKVPFFKSKIFGFLKKVQQENCVLSIPDCGG